MERGKEGLVMARKSKVYNVDFNAIESRSYKSLNDLGREIVDKMIEMQEEKEGTLTEAQKARLDLVTAAMAELTVRQKDVLSMAFGVDKYQGDGPMSERQIAERLKLSQTAVHDIKVRAIVNIQKHVLPLNESAIKNIKKSRKL